MTVAKFVLPTTIRAPRGKIYIRFPAIHALVSVALIIFGLIASMVMAGEPLTPTRLWRRATFAAVPVFAAPLLLIVLWRPKPTSYVTGSVSYVRERSELTIRPPLVLKVLAIAYWAVAFIGLGACSAIAFCWTFSFGIEPGFTRWIGMAATSMFLPFGIGLAVWAILYVRTTRGVTLAPGHIRAEADQNRLGAVSWELLRSVAVTQSELEKRAPSFRNLAITTENGGVLVSSMSIGSDPHAVQRVIEFYWQHPEHRHVLADPRAALDLVKQSMLAET